MKLEEAMQYDEFFLLEVYQGFKKVGKLTGRYAYHSVFKEEDENRLMVEVKTGLFSKAWVNIDLLRPIKQQKSKNNVTPFIS